MMGNGMMDFNKVTVLGKVQKEIIMKVFGNNHKLMDMGLFNTKMAINIKDIGSLLLKTDLANSIIIMDQFLKEILEMIYPMETDNFI